MFATLLLPHVLVSALLLCVLPCFSALASAQQTFFPPEWPLAVRSPYLSSWEAATKGSQPPYNWPKTSVSLKAFVTSLRRDLLPFLWGRLKQFWDGRGWSI